jgi:hypothetical protein
MRPLPLVFEALPAPLDVILLVCMSSPIYLEGVSHVDAMEQAVSGLTTARIGCRPQASRARS